MCLKRRKLTLCESCLCDAEGGDVALIGLDESGLILPGSWGSSQTYPTPSMSTSKLQLQPTECTTVSRQPSACRPAST